MADNVLNRYFVASGSFESPFLGDFLQGARSANFNATSLSLQRRYRARRQISSAFCLSSVNALSRVRVNSGDALRVSVTFAYIVDNLSDSAAASSIFSIEYPIAVSSALTTT